MIEVEVSAAEVAQEVLFHNLTSVAEAVSVFFKTKCSGICLVVESVVHERLLGSRGGISCDMNYIGGECVCLDAVKIAVSELPRI